MARRDQVPTNSGFSAKTTGAEVTEGIELAGKTAIVTGGYSGLGLETTRVLAAKGAHVIVPVRTEEKAAESLAGIEGSVTTAQLDLGDLASVRAFVHGMLEQRRRLDLLIDNAGIMACPEARVGPGWESQFGINHMGHFALTTGLLPLLEKTDGARVIVLSSMAHKISDIRWDDIQFEQGYDKWKAYGQAKTANALFANALSRRMKSSGGLAFSLHPGAILTPLQRHLPTEEMVQMGWVDEHGEPTEKTKKRFKTPEQGCSTTLWAATSEALLGKPGVYCEDCDVAAVPDPDSKAARFSGVDAHATSDESAEKLWEISEGLLAQA